MDRKDPVAANWFKGTAAQTVGIGLAADYLVITNDGTSTLNVSVDNFAFELAAGETFDERLTRFDRIVIGAGTYHGYVRRSEA